MDVVRGTLVTKWNQVWASCPGQVARSILQLRLQGMFGVGWCHRNNAHRLPPGELVFHSGAE